MGNPKCSETAKRGSPCGAFAAPGYTRCRWHEPELREKHLAESRKGGLAKAYGALTAGDPLNAAAAVAKLDLSTAGGMRDLLAATLSGLAGLPFDVRIAHAIASVAGIQKATIETADHEQRLAALEAEQQ